MRVYPGSGAESATRFFELSRFKLRSGDILARVSLAYELYGEINPAGDNVILLFHALTGSQHAAGITADVEGVERWVEENQTGWWEGFVGPGLAVDTDRYAVLCVNYLGGCYGSTGPASINDETGKPYGATFPPVQLADIVESQLQLLDHLGVSRLRAVAGASVGALLSLSLAARFPRPGPVGHRSRRRSGSHDASSDAQLRTEAGHPQRSQLRHW